MGLLDNLLEAGKDVAEQQLGQLLQQLGQEGEWGGVVSVVEQHLGQGLVVVVVVLVKLMGIARV